MSVSSLPEWKQLLLERKRREEEERERREKEEEEKLASMPAWKRGIIQRRRAKQECLGDKDREKEREGFLSVDGKSTSDSLSDTDSSLNVNVGSEPSLSPDPQRRVSVETIVPVHENPFIRTQSGWRWAREAEKAEVGYHERGAEQEAEVGKDKETEKDKPSPRGHDGESGRGRDIELKIERFLDRSEGRERDRSRGRETVKDATREKERECLKAKKEEEKEEERDANPPSPLFAPLVPGLRTIRADNIIIIEQDRKTSDEKRGRWREAERERLEEDHQEKIGVKMDLRELLAGGGSVTEIRASEVLIIKPSASPEDRSGGTGGGRNGDKERELKCTRDGGRDGAGRDVAWMREKEREAFKDKERPRGQATVIKEERKHSCDDSMFVERGGRVTQLLSRFGEHPKPPCRSKSSDNFTRLTGGKDSGDQEDDASDKMNANGRNVPSKGAPKRSFSFCDRAVSAKENGVVEEGHCERKAAERMRPDRRAAPWVEVEKEATPKIKPRWSRLSGKDWLGKRKDGHAKTDRQPEVCTEREPVPDSGTRHNAEIHTSARHRADVSTVERVETVDKRAVEVAGDVDGEEGFTVAALTNTGGICFARRVPIRQDSRTRAMEREAKRLREESERTSERERSVEKGREGGPRACEKWASDVFPDETVPAETIQQAYAVTVSVDPAKSSRDDESLYRPASSFTEYSSLLCTVADRPAGPHKGTEWSGIGPQGPFLTQSVLSQHTEDLITKIERIGETSVYSSERGERSHRGTYEISKESPQAHNAHIYSDIRSENLIHDVPKSPKRITPMGMPPGPLEIQIPRSVFYVAEEMLDRKRLSWQSDEGQDREGGTGVERRNSWRTGKPLSRVESLREKIRQRERERMKHMESGAGDGAVRDGTEVAVTQRAGDRYEERGIEMERDWEAATQMRKRLAETERGQDSFAAQTSTAAVDVTQEVNTFKTCPQLPVSLPFSQAVRVEEVTSGLTAAVSNVASDSFQISGEDDDPQKHVEEELESHRGWQSEYNSGGEVTEEEEEQLSQEEEYTSESLSPSPPHPNSLAAMSRIYNLKTVGSRTGLCVQERAVEISSVQLVKVKPHISHAQQEPCRQETADVRQLWDGGKHGDSKAFSGEDVSGVQAIQCQVVQLQLKEQEVVKASQDDCAPSNAPLKDQERAQSPRGGKLHQVKENDLKTQQMDQQTSASSPRISEFSQRVCSPTLHFKQIQSSQSRMLNRTLLSQYPDNYLKPSDCASSPSSSPAQSPSVSPCPSPSPTASPTLFSIRSASGGKVKRGATITITPKKPVGGGAAATTPPGPKTSAQQAQNRSTDAGVEPMKKRYPTVEEIEVIGGYQNLEKSCLVKNRGTPKRMKVCFDEAQLEQVCEYPSESSMLAYTSCPHDQRRDERVHEEEAQEEEEEEEEEEESGVILVKSPRTAGTATGQVRVGQCHPLLKKHKV